jgi:hypothetical protein
MIGRVKLALPISSNTLSCMQAFFLKNIDLQVRHERTFHVKCV